MENRKLGTDIYEEDLKNAYKKHNEELESFLIDGIITQKEYDDEVDRAKKHHKKTIDIIRSKIQKMEN